MGGRSVQLELDTELNMQLLIATHSPLVMTSVEPVFDIESDKLFHLDLVQKDLVNREVQLKNVPFVKYGRADSWLTSDVFELEHARSIEAQAAIKEAEELQLRDEPEPEKVRSVSEKLVKHLSDQDEFWPRWISFAEQYGVEL